MTVRKVTEISARKADDRKHIRDAINPVAARAHLGEVRGVVVVAIYDDLSVSMEFEVTSDGDILTLIGSLEAIKSDMLKD